MQQRWARPWFATTFVLVVVELVITTPIFLVVAATWPSKTSGSNPVPGASSIALPSAGPSPRLSLIYI